MPNTIVDTCCLVNLCAIGDLHEFIPSTGMTWHVPSAVAKECIRVCIPGQAGPASKRDVDLGEYLESGVLVRCDVGAAAETELYVRLAAELDDGEAMALALAKTRGWSLATDDRKARRLSEKMTVPVLTTPQIVRIWAERNSVGVPAIAMALARIRDLARFVPSEGFPEYEWWMKHLPAGA